MLGVCSGWVVKLDHSALWVVHKSLLLFPYPLLCHSPCSLATPLTIDWHSNPRRVTQSLLERLMPLSPHRKTSRLWCPGNFWLDLVPWIIYWDHNPGWEEQASWLKKKAVCFSFELWKDPVCKYILDKRGRMSEELCSVFCYKMWIVQKVKPFVMVDVSQEYAGPPKFWRCFQSQKLVIRKVLFVYCIPVLILIKLQISLYILLENLKLHCNLLKKLA